MNQEYETLYSYLDTLLRVQSNAANMYEHTGVLGTVRENFLVNQIKERVDDAKLHTGQIIAENINAGQCDIILRKNNTLNPALGSQVRIVSNDCSLVIEVKSNAVGNDFRDLNLKAGLLKRENPDIVCGIFCYKIECRKETILGRFGYNYDREYSQFEIDEGIAVLYPNIDFVVCIDDEQENARGGRGINYNKFFFLNKNVVNSAVYDLILKPPFSFYFLSEIMKKTIGA